jgi:DNA segregation ATPase FtsK/SpoIIIE-like protein
VRQALYIPLPGTNTVGIEVPNRFPYPVYLRTMLENKEYLANRKNLYIPLGMDVEGNPVSADLTKMPHLLVAGTTGSGKSVFINSVINSLLFACSSNDLKLVLVDVKQVELSVYEELPQLLMPIATDAKQASFVLKKLIGEMERRYAKFSKAGVKNIESYNAKANEKLPFIVLVVDELADLLMVAPDEVEDSIQRLAQLARAAGIHMILATQRPTKQVLSTTIKANLPVRIAFSVASTADSMTILDAPGAEELLGRGDMFYQPSDMPRVRLQSPYVSDSEISRVTQYLVQNL